MQVGKVAMPKNTRQSYTAHFDPGTAFWWTQPNTSSAVWPSTGAATTSWTLL